MKTKLPLFIARRYFFSRKQKTVINVISWVSLIGVTVSTMALIVVLSVYNGIGDLTKGLFNTFDPPLLVQPAQGKTFRTSDFDYKRLCSLPGVAAVSQLAEENAWITYNHNEAIVSLRGVDTLYPRITGLDTMLYEGTYQLSYTPENSVAENCEIVNSELTNDRASHNSQFTIHNSPTTVYYLLFGGDIYYNLGIREASNLPVSVHIPKRGVALGMTMEEAFNTGYAMPGGNFTIQKDIDNLYVVSDIAFVRSLMDYASDECTSLALSLVEDANVERTKREVRELLGDGFTVKDRFEQKPLYYKVFRSERLGIYLILTLIVLISTLNLIASLSLLVLDKKRDAATLRSLGMMPSDIRRTFRIEGLLISAFGVAVGLIGGFVVCLLQQQFGIVKMGDNFVVSAFPVSMRAIDFLLTFVIVMSISLLSVLLATRRAGYNSEQ
ncbi:MAG: FtsX-like permease family protein [Bacteroidales bacterium]|nr:FtsX-like permease family protein [Bacteroidales bacterium]